MKKILAQFLGTLSGRFILLTLLFSILTNGLVYMAIVTQFQRLYLQVRIEKAQLAALALDNRQDEVSTDFEQELLQNASIISVTLKRDSHHTLALAGNLNVPIYKTYDLREQNFANSFIDMITVLWDDDEHYLRIIDTPRNEGGIFIETIIKQSVMHHAISAFVFRIVYIPIIITFSTFLLLLFVMTRIIIRPIRRVTDHMKAYARAPEDARWIITPTAQIHELRETEEALQKMQSDLTNSLRQKEHLAQLGGAVAKISHDLRNILTSTQLFAERIEKSADPIVAKSAPKLVASVARAVHLCESTMAFGKAEEPPPRLTYFPLRRLVEDVLDAEGLNTTSTPSAIIDIISTMMIRADQEQLYRIINNLVRNARQAIESASHTGEINISAFEDPHNWSIHIRDTGPGLPPQARDNLFTAFQGSARKGGIGLGLVIVSELVRGHGGQIKLGYSGDQGTEFILQFPKSTHVQNEKPSKAA